MMNEVTEKQADRLIFAATAVKLDKGRSCQMEALRDQFLAAEIPAMVSWRRPKSPA